MKELADWNFKPNPLEISIKAIFVLEKEISDPESALYKTYFIYMTANKYPITSIMLYFIARSCFDNLSLLLLIRILQVSAG